MGKGYKMQNEQMLEYIRNYYIESDVVVPKRASVPGFNLRVLSKRLHDARNAFLVLIDNNMFVDACLIAGHILEVSATIHYIRSAADKMLNSRRYIAKSTIQSVYDLLGIDNSNLQDDKYRLTINEFLDYLEDVGHLILKPIKKEDKKQLNYKFVSKLRCLELTNKEKRKLIKEFYEMPIVNDYLNCFYSGMQKNIQTKPEENPDALKEALKLFYVSYCRIKHTSALLYPGEIKADHIIILDNEEKLCVPAVALSLDMISDSPSYFVQASI